MSELKKDTVAENTAEVKTKKADDKAAKTEKTEKPKKDKKNGGFKNFLKSRNPLCTLTYKTVKSLSIRRVRNIPSLGMTLSNG